VQSAPVDWQKAYLYQEIVISSPVGEYHVLSFLLQETEFTDQQLQIVNYDDNEKGRPGDKWNVHTNKASTSMTSEITRAERVFGEQSWTPCPGWE
jgi:hypothetical protein